VAERALSQRELNRAVLARQLLLERARLPLPRAVEQLAGIQNQYAPNGYLRLWSCLDGFRRDGLTQALERRELIQATLLRGTIHLVSREDFWAFALAIRPAREAWWRRVDRPDAEALDLDAAVARTRGFLAGTTRTHAELSGHFARLGGAPVARGVGTRLELVRVPPSGTWERRRAHTFALAEEWVGPPDVAEEDALVHLARRYLEGFGPAAARDFADWAGLPVRTARAALERHDPVRYVDEDGTELLDLPGSPLPAAERPAPVRFLPTWDAVLLVHARRTGVLPEPYRPRIFSTKTPHSFGTFLVDGAVAGTWRHDGGRVVTECFERLDAASRRDLDDEAGRLAAFHA
jgi:winged helix DNA-binding protein